MVGLEAPGVRELRHAEQVDLVRHDQGGPGARSTARSRRQCSADRQKLTTSCGYEAESDCHCRGVVCALGVAKYVLAAWHSKLGRSESPAAGGRADGRLPSALSPASSATRRAGLRQAPPAPLRRHQVRQARLRLAADRRRRLDQDLAPRSCPMIYRTCSDGQESCRIADDHIPAREQPGRAGIVPAAASARLWSPAGCWLGLRCRAWRRR